MGYFLALSWFYYRHKRALFWLGLAMATAFHWIFNLFISQMQQTVSLFFSTLLLIAMAFLISVLFDKIKERDALVHPSVA